MELCQQRSTLASQAREGLHQLWVLPLLLSVTLLFARVFRHSFIASATVLSLTLFIHRPFYLAFFPYMALFVTQMGAGSPHPGSTSVPALTKLSFPADAWSWTTHIVDSTPLVYQLRLWATKYEVPKLLNMFQPTYACSQ